MEQWIKQALLQGIATGVAGAGVAWFAFWLNARQNTAKVVTGLVSELIYLQGRIKAVRELLETGDIEGAYEILYGVAARESALQRLSAESAALGFEVVRDLTRIENHCRTLVSAIARTAKIDPLSYKLESLAPDGSFPSPPESFHSYISNLETIVENLISLLKGRFRLNLVDLPEAAANFES